MTSIYKTDMGNGVVIYADDYVKTGHWVFDCDYSRLISRNPIPAPVAEISATKEFKIGNMYELNETDKALAMKTIRDLEKTPNWHTGLRYLYSGLDENSDLRHHSFYLLTRDSSRTWVVELDQSIYYDGKSRFTISAKPYDLETYLDHDKALKAAAKSCPAPQ